MQALYSEKDLLASLSANAAIAVAGLIALAALRAESRPDLFSCAAMTAFIGYIVTRALMSPSPYHARADLYSALGCFLLYALAATALSVAWRRIAILLALIAFGVMHVAASAVQAGWGENYALLFPFLAEVERSGRGAGFYINPDHLAGLLEVLGIVGLSITCWSRWPKWSKVIAA